MKRRLISVITVLAICLTLVIPSATAFAATELPYWDKAVTIEGRTLTLTITSKNASGSLCGGTVELGYDPEILEYVEGSASGLATENGIINGLSKNNSFIANFALAKSLDSDAVLVTVQFNIAEGKTCPSNPFTVIRDKLFNAGDATTGPKQVNVDSDGKVITPTITVTCSHKDKTEEVTTPATCKADGVKTITCSDCGEATQEAIAKLDHKWDDGVVTKEATATEKGTKKFTCTLCGTTKTEEVDYTKPFDPATDTYWEKTVAVDGKKVTVTYKSVNGAGVLCGGTIKMTYDPAVLTLNPEGTYTSIGSNFGTGFINTASGKFISNFAGANAIKNDGILAVAVFDINEGQICNKDTFKLESETLYNENLKAFGKLLVPITFSCTHKNSTESIKTPASCTATGLKAVVCSDCGETIETTIDKLSHEYDSGVITTSPTCTEKGVKTFTCKNCKDTKTTEIPAKGHTEDEGTIEKQASCEEAGVFVTKCKDCKKELSRVEIPATGHKWDNGVVTKEATATEKGTKKFTCTLCSATKTESIDYDDSFDPATDTYWEKTVAVDGKKVTVTYRTKNGAGVLCGGRVKMTYDPAVLTLNPEGTYTNVGATFGLGVINTQAGKFIANFAKATPITKDDILAVAVFDINEGQVCNKDTFKLELETLYDDIPAACGKLLVPLTFTCTHKNSTESIKTPASCTATGLKTVVCSDCGETIETTIDKLSHEYDGGVITTSPTCTEKGVKTFTCKNCKDTKTTEIPAKGHTEDEGTIEKQASCEEAGVFVIKCKDCKKELSRVEIPATGHKWDDGVVIKEATATEKGTKKFTCTLCGATKTESIDYDDSFDPATDTYWEKTVAVDGKKVTVTYKSVNGAGVLCGGTIKMTYDPAVLTLNPEGTYTSIGSNFGMGFINTASGKFISNFAGATAIKNDGILAVAVFDINEGQICNKDTFKLESETLYNENAKAFGKLLTPITFSCTHKNSTESIKTPASCTATGLKAVVCSDCGETIETTIDKLSHEYDSGVITTSPTCTEKGVKTFTCKNCKDTKTTEIPAKGHTPGKETVEVEPTLTTEGISRVRCTVCQKILEETIIPKSLKYGDLDGNGIINSKDAIIVLRYDAEEITFTSAQKLAADVDGNGIINSKDAILILRYDAEVINSFPVEDKK